MSVAILDSLDRLEYQQTFFISLGHFSPHIGKTWRARHDSNSNNLCNVDQHIADYPVVLKYTTRLRYYYVYYYTVLEKYNITIDAWHLVPRTRPTSLAGVMCGGPASLRRAGAGVAAVPWSKPGRRASDGVTLPPCPEAGSGVAAIPSSGDRLKKFHEAGNLH